MGSDLNDMIDKTNDPTKKKELTQAAEAIVKICGNKSILINQINPDNFLQIWETLKALMNPGAYDNLEIKKQLLGLVVLKDNIGEALWYFYTAVLLISIVQYNLSSRGCVVDPKTMAENHQKFVEAEDAKIKQDAKASSQIYAG